MQIIYINKTDGIQNTVPEDPVTPGLPEEAPPAPPVPGVIVFPLVVTVVDER
jgi:hypothetical protein